MQLTNYARQALLANALASVTGGDFSGTFKNCKVGLFAEGSTLLPDAALADLVEVAFAGYGQKAVTWSAPLVDQASRVLVVGSAATFISTAAETGVIAAGAFLSDGATPPKLLAYEAFDNPVPIVGNGHGVVIIPELTLPPDNWGTLGINL